MGGFVNGVSWALAAVQALLFVTGAPLFAGWVKWLKARLQNRRGAPAWQPYRDLRKLFAREVVVAHTASPVFRAAPYVVFLATVLAVAVVPLVALNLPTAAIADAIVLVGLLGLARFFLALAGMDVGTTFGGMGASREMLVSSLAEPALLLAVFTVAMTAHTTNLASMAAFTASPPFLLRPSFLFALGALVMVGVAETGRIPVDNPATHLELTMIHEGMLLEYSGRHLALMEWAAQLKLILFGVLTANIFFPWGIARSIAAPELALALGAITLKLGLLGVGLALGETVLAKMRLFRVPLYLNVAFVLALLGLISHVILEVGS